MTKGTGTSRAARPNIGSGVKSAAYKAPPPPGMQQRVERKPKKKASSKEAKKAEGKKPFRKGVVWLSETIAIWDMFRVKGKPGIWLMHARPHKSGMVRMQQFLTVNYCTVRTDTLEGLSELIIKKEVGDDMPLIEAFDNLQEYSDNKPFDETPNYKSESFLNIICSGYDPDEFKHYHAKKIVAWYNELVIGLNDKENE